MDLNPSKPHPDAIIISREHAKDYFWHLVTGWNCPGDVWALRYGCGILGGLSGLTGVIINSHYRTRLRLGPNGSFSTLLPVVFLPGLFTVFFHRQMVSTDILIRQQKTCFVCLELKSAVIQLGFGIVYPMIMGPLCTFMLANRFSTYRVPSLTEEPIELLRFFKRTSRTLTGPLSIMILIHLIGSSAVSYCERKNQLKIQAKLDDIERKIEESQR